MLPTNQTRFVSFLRNKVTTRLFQSRSDISIYLARMLYFFDVRASVCTCWRITGYYNWRLKVGDMGDIIRKWEIRKETGDIKKQQRGEKAALMKKILMMIILGLWMTRASAWARYSLRDNWTMTFPDSWKCALKRQRKITVGSAFRTIHVRCVWSQNWDILFINQG